MRIIYFKATEGGRTHQGYGNQELQMIRFQSSLLKWSLH
jgi:hypothetical protein